MYQAYCFLLLEFNHTSITRKYIQFIREASRSNGGPWYAAAERPYFGLSTTAATATTSGPDPPRATASGNTGPEHADWITAGTTHGNSPGRVPRTTQD